MFSIYVPDGSNIYAIYGARVGEFEDAGSAVLGVESSTVVFLEGHFLFTCSDTFAVECFTYLQRTASQTDGWTDRRHHANSC